jgi:hypothetical protein
MGERDLLAWAPSTAGALHYLLFLRAARCVIAFSFPSSICFFSGPQDVERMASEVLRPLL